MITSAVMGVLDNCAKAFTFPALDNGYVYLAAARLSAFRSPSAWWLVVEVFGFSPRASLPDLHIYSFSNQLRRTRTAGDFVTRDAWERYLSNNPNNESVFFEPVHDGDWIDPEDTEHLATGARQVVIRGNAIGLPASIEYAHHGIELAELPHIAVYELCRYLASVARDQVLATPEERRTCVAPDAHELLVLDEWHHPDIVGGQLPSQTETFRQIAEVLTTGDVARYRPTEAANTHWRHWPEGGTL